MNKFIVVSFYTKKTGYEREAMKLERSLMTHNVPYHIASVPNLRSWQKNTHFKAIFIRNMLKEFFGVDIVWTDADSVFHAYPALFDTIDCDIAAHFRNWRYGENEFLSGTLYLSNNDRVRHVVEDWHRINSRNKMNLEQRNLYQAVRKARHNLKIYKLPIEYCCIFDDEQRRKIKPVVEHFQRSRQYKKRVRI